MVVTFNKFVVDCEDNVEGIAVFEVQYIEERISDFSAEDGGKFNRDS